jgi:hypothetical protein
VTVQKLSYFQLLSDEAVVDGRLGSEAVQRAAAARIEAREIASRAAWKARPWHERARFRLCWRLSGPRSYLAHVWDALRGIECEGNS